MVLAELVACERDAGELAQAVGHALELAEGTWDIHCSQTAQLVDEVWARAEREQERHALEVETAEAHRLAEHDPLTRVGNRRLLERVLAGAADEEGNLAVLMADIDHFKAINDTFGHEVGDEVLRRLGGILGGEARSGQVVVRYGGEEFVFALFGVSAEAAVDIAERTRHKVRDYPWEDIESRLGVTISVGVATGPTSSWRSLVQEADKAMYRAKKNGRDRVEITEVVRKTA